MILSLVHANASPDRSSAFEVMAQRERARAYLAPQTRPRRAGDPPGPLIRA